MVHLRQPANLFDSRTKHGIRIALLLLLKKHVPIRIDWDELRPITLVKVFQLYFDDVMIDRKTPQKILKPHARHKLPHKLRAVLLRELCPQIGVAQNDEVGLAFEPNVAEVNQHLWIRPRVYARIDDLDFFRASEPCLQESFQSARVGFFVR